MEETWIYHYGVKGMKWGVRRSLGVKARGAAVYRTLIKTQQKAVDRLEKKRETKGLTDRQQRNLDRGKKVVAEWTETRNKLIKDLSEKDIKRGQRAVLTYYSLGSMSGAAMAVSMVRANKQLEREKNRR